MDVIERTLGELRQAARDQAVAAPGEIGCRSIQMACGKMLVSMALISDDGTLLRVEAVAPRAVDVEALLQRLRGHLMVVSV